ncbi:serine hydrolase domain-containing protein [uncultured Cyclobacterium sp.]|uniref:serine hydrolase domain-containing protein n=1 Tax=uncultured Cyclobacterium sp. TaxID=453820 RepID=UPI0030ED0143|tara:strand:- start:104422 stop:105489 length:1068 start_codon:yes stop_codon:yes gene_type:complete
MTTTDRESTIFTAWNKALNQFSNQKKIPGLVLSIYKENSEPLLWSGTTGDVSLDQPYFITELGNLHLLAIVLKLKVRGLLRMDQPITDFLIEKDYEGLISIRGKDYTHEVTISHLLSQNSGIPDFLNYSKDNENPLKEDILSGIDQEWGYAEVLKRTKNQKPDFKPGQSKKRVYSSTNDQLLGKVIESINGESLEKTLNDFHFSRLSMNQTYVYKDPNDRTPSLYSYKNKPLNSPLSMVSFGASGGIVSTAKDSLSFVKAFFHGHLFPLSELENTKQWLPFRQGLSQGKGLLRFQKSRILPTTTKDPEIIGNSGFTSGAFSFYIPEFQTFMTGTTNQLDDPLLPYKLAYSMIKHL